MSIPSSPRSLAARLARLQGLYAIVDSAFAESVPQHVQACLAGGATALQLRCKGMASGRFVELARAAVAGCRRAGAILIVNDRADVALAAGADGVHLGQEDLPVEAARALLGPEALIGVSAYSDDQLDAASAAGADYVGFGPVFETRTRIATSPDAKPLPAPHGIAGVERAARRARLPVVAIGGLTGEHAEALGSSGAVAGAVISWLCQEGEAEQRARDFGQAFRRGRDRLLARGRGRQAAQGEEARTGRPVIGLSCDLGYTVERPGRPSLPRYEVKRSYADAVLAAGGLPVLLPYDGAPTAAAELLGFCDGLVVTGGTFDVPPDFYGQPPHPRLGPVLPERAGFERRLLEEALGRGVPVLGVCGGMQLLAVVAGGELWQDITAQVPDATDHEQAHDPRTPGHRVLVEAGTRLRAAVQTGEIWVNSAHHQSVRNAGRARVSARSPDGLVEAIELPEGFAVGVQWHPELLAEPAHLAIFSAFVAACRARDATV